MHHVNPRSNFFKLDGWRKGKQRYRCKSCGKSFGESNFSLDYRMKKRDIFASVFHLSTQGLSNRSIARTLKISETTVRNRLKHLSRQALLSWEQKLQETQITEPVVYDGLESFVFSQYDPNNLNHSVGK